VLVLAREMGVLKLGTVALDGTKVHATPAGTERCPMSTRATAASPVSLQQADRL